jgi:putative phosphoesterase
MKVLIFSDSHRSFAPMMKAVEEECGTQHIIHAGDVHSDVEDLIIMYPRLPVAFVKGNNDPFLRDVPDDRFFELDGVKIFLTHGHNYGVKYSLSRLYQKGAALGADICIFGHTHSAHNEKIENITLFNPGAAHRSYGVLEIKDGSFCLEIKEI